MSLFGNKKSKERTIWSGANSLLTNPLKKILMPEYYKITSFRLWKSDSNLFHLGSTSESMELWKIQQVKVDQGPYQKVIGLGAGDIIILSSDSRMVWHSVPRCKHVESTIWEAVQDAKRNAALGIFPG